MSKYVTTTDGESENAEPIGSETHFGVAEMLPDGTCRDIVAPTPGLSKDQADAMVARLTAESNVKVSDPAK